MAALAPDIEDRCDGYDTCWLDGSESSASPYNAEIARHFLEQEEKVLALVADCNRAIRNGESFDFVEYVEFWKGWDKHFAFRVDPNCLFVE